MGLGLERAALPELLAHPAHRRHAETRKLCDLAGAFAPFIELQNAPAHRHRYRSHRHTLSNNLSFVKLHNLWKCPKMFILQRDTEPLSSAPVWVQPSELAIGMWEMARFPISMMPMFSFSWHEE